MTTTMDDPSTLKTPASLSGGDLVSRLLAATPPYLYNIPLTPHSFFFSEMLRSFVQTKTEASTAGDTTAPVAPRRRKRTWRDARDRPLELTMKDRSNHQHDNKYYHLSQNAAHAENSRSKHSMSESSYNVEGKSQLLPNFDQMSSFGDILKPVDENKVNFTKHCRNYFDDRHHRYGPEHSVPLHDGIFGIDIPKVKPEEPLQSGEIKTCNSFGERNNNNTFGECAKANGGLPSFLPDQKSKLDFAPINFLPAMTAARIEEMQAAVKSFNLQSNVSNPEFPTSPAWYPPYPISQSYPGFDPLHFFIDLRVSGHICDRKLTERPFKSKNCSAFSVPQSKEFNRPLNLTRDEASTSKEENFKGTHYILKNLTRTYKDIQDTEKSSKTESSELEAEEKQKDSQVGSSSQTQEPADGSDSASEDVAGKKNLRAFIGLELVVDYVKEPKEDLDPEESLRVAE